MGTVKAEPTMSRFPERSHARLLVANREWVETVHEDRSRALQPFQGVATNLVVREEVALVKVEEDGEPAKLGEVLSPSQVRTFLDCSARWWFKYGLGSPEPKTSSQALGTAIHRALEVNFREKLETKEDLSPAGVVLIFREAWRQQAEQIEFREDEDRQELCAMGERMVAKYMDETAATIEPALVEADVAGEIAGVKIRGRVDLVDTKGRIIDVKTAARRPNGVAPDYAFQLATYRQVTPGATGEAELHTLVKTKAVQLIRMSFNITEQEVLATRTLYPLVQEGIRSNLYFPNRQSLLCNRRNCAFWRQCEREYGGTVEAS